MTSEFFARVSLRKVHICNIWPKNVKMLTDHLLTVYLGLYPAILRKGPCQKLGKSYRLNVKIGKNY